MKISAAELWNGFTTDMTGSQVIARARETLKISDENLNCSYSRDNVPFVWRAIVAEKFPAYESCFAYKSTLPAYDQLWDKNIFFFFSKSKLFAVEIFWTATGTDLLDAAKKQYGDYDYLTEDRSLCVYNWKLIEKLLYVSTNSVLFIIDRQLVEIFMDEEKLRIQAERKQSIEGIIF
jgi:hypothetical protein